MANNVTLTLVDLQNAAENNLIVGQSHFIKTVEDIHELMVNCVPGAQFGVAFCEASGPRLIRHSGTDEGLEKEAVRMAQAVGVGHAFFIVMHDMYPINVLPRLKEVPEIAGIFCATANPVHVVVAESTQGRPTNNASRSEAGRGIIGVIDGGSPLGVETEKDITERKSFLRKIGYKG